MSTTHPSNPKIFGDLSLNDDEFDRLSDLLEKAGPTGKNIEWIDGYFAALICAPEFVPPSEALNEILDEGLVFENQEEAGDVVGLLMRHWNTIASELQRSISEPHVYLPVLLEDEVGVARGNDWAKGFMRGVQTWPQSWRELLLSEEHGGSALPMMMLAYEDDPDPGMRPPPIPDDAREEVHLQMVAGLTRIFRHFEPARRQRAASPPVMSIRRSTPKVGRNEPCLCGSGRKYKQCCGQARH